LKGDVIDVYSAGIETHGLNPYAVQVMREAGVDISKQRSKNVSEFVDREFDYVITVCSDADEKCPFFSARTKVIHHGFDDPPKLPANAKSEEEKISHYLCVRDEIKTYVETLPESLV